MNRIAISLLALLLCLRGVADETNHRPRILGVANVQFYSTNIAAARGFYMQVLHPEGACLWCEEVPTSPLSIPLSSGQRLTLSTPPKTPPSNLLYELVFATEDVQAIKRYLAANNISIQKQTHRDDRDFTVVDPEGHRVGFTQLPPSIPMNVIQPGTMHIIHAGFVVRDRAAEDHFYKDILGFHLYWHGGMKDDKDDWVAMQVPDGTDWLEYMLNVSPNADHHTLGVMNHIALGVEDIHATEKQLIANGWKPGETPKMGRDGKWQLNVYDPDDTRVEFMEFKPVEKPCCSEFTGPHPGPQN